MKLGVNLTSLGCEIVLNIANYNRDNRIAKKFFFQKYVRFWELAIISITIILLRFIMLMITNHCQSLFWPSAARSWFNLSVLTRISPSAHAYSLHFQKKKNSVKRKLLPKTWFDPRKAHSRRKFHCHCRDQWVQRLQRQSSPCHATNTHLFAYYVWKTTKQLWVSGFSIQSVQQNGVLTPGLIFNNFLRLP